MKWKLIAFATLVVIIAGLAFSKKNKVPETLSYLFNPNLATVKPTPDWKGTPINSEGIFVNLYHPFESSFGDLWKWQTSKNPQKEEKEAETRRLPVDRGPFHLNQEDDYLLWLGHATYLMQINGLVILTDPLLFDNMFLKRESELPFPVDSLPRIDLLLISHNHRDHCDKKTIKYLSDHNRDMKILTGLKLGEIIGSWTEGQTIEEAGWYQQYIIPDNRFEITYVPSRHWSRRWLWDLNENLWGGFFIKYGNKSIYFMGDSGMGPHFEDIKNTMGNPDHCLMGVGAYKPEWFMSQSHVSPSDAIKAFNIMEGKYFIPMHFGTFDLSDEPRMEPWDVLKKNERDINGKLVFPILGKNLLQ